MTEHGIMLCFLGETMADLVEQIHPIKKNFSLLTIGFLGGLISILIIWQIASFSSEIYLWFSKQPVNGQIIREYALYFLSIIFCIYIARQILCSKYPEIKKSLTFVAFCFGLLASIVTCVLLSQSGQNYQTSLTVLISSIVLGTGWWIQSLITASSARKSHTLNTIMNQRHSSHYFAKLDNVFNTFGLKNSINEEIAEEYYNGHKSGPKVKDELIQGCRDASFILSYYEFIAVGVIRKDFDEALIKECFFEPMQAFEKRTFHLISVFRKKDGDKSKILENYIAILDKWLPDSSLTTRKKNNTNTQLPDNCIKNTVDIYEESSPVTVGVTLVETDEQLKNQNPS